MLCVLVNTGFQVLFHSPPGVLFTFPSQYCFTIGHQVVFRLGGWAPRLPCRFHVPARTLDSASILWISPTGLSPCFVYLPMYLGYPLIFHVAVLNPYHIATVGLASSAFARRYSQNLFWFLFLRVLRCFSSPRSLRKTMYSSHDLAFFMQVVAQFGNLRIDAYLQLPAAYRS